MPRILPVPVRRYLVGPAGIAVLYLLLSGIALTVNLADVGYSVAGLHSEEVDGATGRPFRWSTGRRALIRTPVAGASIRLPLLLSRPDVAGFPRQVILSVNGRRVDEALFTRSGWSDVSCFLPPVLGTDAWRRIEVAWAALDGKTVPDLAVAFDQRWRTGLGRSPRDAALIGALWRRATRPLLSLPGASPAPDLPFVDIEVAVDGTFVPASADGGTRDYRRLGVGVGRPRWTDRPGSQGIGFYAWEETSDGRRFRWTGRTGSMRLRVRDRMLELPLAVSHPDVAAAPVEISIYWDARKIATVVRHSAGWSTVRLGPDIADPGTTGVLTLAVNRVWSPALPTGTRPPTTDSRFLGVAVGVHRWVPVSAGSR